MIKFVYQNKPKGTGDAVLKTKKYIKDKYFLMLFPDDLIIKNNCSKSMISSHKKYKASVMASMSVNKKTVSRWGIYKLNKKTIVSIFVNPKQFNETKDFKSYPSNIKNDLSILKKIKNLDFIYIPQFKDIYENKKQSQIKIKKKDKILCAKYRKGHFEGVLDVMNRLTKLIKPKKIYMGKKDFQQFFLVRNFIEKKFNIKVVGCKTIRNKNKLALSSRNFLLD